MPLTDEHHAAVPTVTIGGAPLPPTVAARLTRVTVEGQRNLPWSCEVEFSDASEVMDQPLLRPGQALEVTSSGTSNDPSQVSVGPLFQGEIVAVEAGFAPGGTRASVRGYDKSHRLHRTRRTRTFLMQTDQMIATQIAGDCNLAPRTDPTGGPHPYLCQRNQTDWEFLTERAREIGFEVGVSPRELIFRKVGADPLAGPPRVLALGQGLLSLRARISSAEQPSTVTGSGWDPALKQRVRAVASPVTPENTPGDATLLATTVASAFGSTQDEVVGSALGSQAMATDRAGARRMQLAGLAFEADGVSHGNPGLVPGGKVRIEDVGTRYSGTYTLSSVRHVFGGDGYLTYFTISGSHDRSLLGLAQPGAASRANGAEVPGHLGAPVLAQVCNTTDPDQLGRVKVALPWLDDQVESTWAPVIAPGGGKGGGWQLVPEVNDQVLVAFEQGDVRRPYVLGGVYNKVDQPPEPVRAVAAGNTELRVFTTRVGHRLTFEDTSGSEQVLLQTKGGSKLVLTDGPKTSIELADPKGNQLTIDGDTGNVTLTAKGKLAVEATQDLELRSQAKVSIVGNGGVDIDGKGPVSVKSSAALSLEGQAATTVKTTGMLTAQGNPIRLN